MAKINPRKVNVFLFDGVNLLDIAGPVQAFTSASLSAPSAYSLRYISSDGRPVRACCGLELVADEALDSQTDADDLLIPGGRGVDACLSDTALIAVIKNWLEERKNRRLISICSGALVLAASGVLDGCKATTHWSRATMARERFPRVDWQLDRIYVTGEQIFTSAGVTTGIDMALSIIRRDCGPETSLAVGRELVVQMQRSGGQEQFSASLAGQQAGDPALSRLVKLIVASACRRLDSLKRWRNLRAWAFVLSVGSSTITSACRQRSSSSACGLTVPVTYFSAVKTLSGLRS